MKNVTDSQNVKAQLTFIVPQEGVPYFDSAALTGADSKAYFETEQHEVNIENMRSIADSLALDSSGFVLRSYPTQVDDLYDDDAIANVYERELQNLLCEASGADDAVIFDYTRRSDADSGATNAYGRRLPASRVHVDYTTKSGPVRARDAMGAQRFDSVIAAGGRVTQMNVWRPIVGPVQRTPLALADASSIGSEELVTTEQRFPDRVGEIYQLAYAPTQRWYWVPEMERDEVLLIKGWDSIDDGRARFTPHGAFQWQRDAQSPARESIEARAFLIFQD